MTKKQTPCNQIFYFDYEQDTLADWAVQAGRQQLKTEFVLQQKQSIILSFAERLYSKGATYNCIEKYRLDDQEHSCSWSHAITSYPGYGGLCKSFAHELSAGRHVVSLECDIPEYMEPGQIILYLHAAPSAGKLPEPAADEIMPCPTAPEYPDTPDTPSLKDYRIGVNADKRSIGRFGFTKGDGLLDCAMPTLGSLTRMYLCGHPDYRKMHRWQYSLLPEGIDPAKRYHGTFAPAQVDWHADQLEITYLSVSWRTKFDRPGKTAINFGCVYSLASAAVMVETDDRQLRLSELEYSGNYTRIMLPLKKGLVVRDITCLETAYCREIDGDLSENFFFLFGATEFPDIPIQVIVQKQPESITLLRHNGLLTELAVNTDGIFGVGFVVSPFGIESFMPNETQSDAFRLDAYNRCHFWSRAALAYPIDAEEYYQVHENSQQVEIAQRFRYRMIKDDWGTTPLKTAPLPPLADMTSDLKDFIMPETSVNFNFPTKYGYLKGLVNADCSSYRLPFIPERRKFPLRAAKDDAIRTELADGWDDYWNFQEKFADKLADDLYYPYPGAYLEKYMIPVWMFTHLDGKALEPLRRRIRENLPRAIDFERTYFYCRTDWGDLMRRYPEADEIAGIYTDPKIVRKQFYGWYDRVEPITGMKYKICYINVSLSNFLPNGRRETIANLPAPLIENDWGTGLAFTAIYLGTLLVDGWETLHKHWETIKGAFEYFRVLQDWCCMSSPYAENGRLWVEGANYGAFTAFARMAEEIGDSESLALARYIGAKQGAARLAIFRSSYIYFYKFFRRGPWYITKTLGDEASASDGFLHVPDLDENGYGGTGIYNLSTEGIFPEVFMLLARNCPDETAHVMELFRQNLIKRTSTVRNGYRWGDIQTYCSRLMFLALSGKIEMEELKKEIAFGDKHEVMLRKWRGIHCPPRYLPKNLLSSYLKALVQAHSYPAWLETWRNLSIDTASFDAGKSVAEVKLGQVRPGARIEFGVTQRPRRVTLNAKEITFMHLGQFQRLTVKPDQAGLLHLEF